MGKSIGQWGPGGHRAIRAAPVKEEPPHDYYHASAKSEGSRLPSSPRRELLEESPRRGGAAPPPHAYHRVCDREGRSRAPEGGAAPPPHAHHHVCDMEGRGEGGPRPRLTPTTRSVTWREGETTGGAV